MTIKGRRALERDNGELNIRLELSHIMVEQLRDANIKLVGQIDNICQKNIIKGFVSFLKLRRVYFKHKKGDKDS